MTTPCLQNTLRAPLAAPRAALVERARAATAAAARSVWKLLQTVGEHRARRELLVLARHNDGTRPELAAVLREAARRGWAD